ncbi:hypothetical protein T06_3122, partial [Trichinella sp. T6]
MERKEASFSISIQQEDCSTRTVYYSRITSYERRHALASCKSKVKCRTEECSKRHHPLIHPNQDKPSVSENQPNTSAIKTVNPHAVYHHEQLDELGRLAPEDPRPVMEIYDEFRSNASTSLDTAAYLPTWTRCRTQCTTVGPGDIHAWMDGWANRLELQLTAEHTKTKSGEQFLMYHSPTNDILIFATD